MKKNFLLLLFLFISFLTLGCLKNKEEIDIPLDIPLENKPEKIDVTTITLNAAGDCTLGTDSNFGYHGHFDWWFNEQVKGNYSYFFSGVRRIFENDDFTFVNLEGPLTKSNNRVEKNFNFKGDPSYVNILKEGSVEGVMFANNHVNDYGEEGYNETIEVLEEAGIGQFGYEHALIKEVNGIRIGFVGYSTVGYWTSKDSEVITGIKSLKDKVDYLIANFHWGLEGHHNMSYNQKRLAHIAIDNGADLVIGSHPHVVQGMEKYKDKYIIYSLGNFVFGGNSNPGDKNAIIAQINLNFKDNNLVEEKIKIIPVSISSTTKRNDYRPIVLEGAAKKKVIDIVNQNSINFKYIDEN